MTGEDLRTLCNRMAAYEQERVAAHKQKQRMENSTLAYVRNLMGFCVTMPEEEREGIAEKARDLVGQLRDAEDVTVDVSDDVIEDAAPVVEFMSRMVKPFELKEATFEDKLSEAAQQLPVWDWWESIRGVNGGFLGQIVGEAGEDRDEYPGIGLGQFPDKGCLWKWFCVHVNEDDHRGQDGNHRRRSIVWLLGTNLMMQNKGRYRKYYDQRKARVKERKPDKPGIAIDDDARVCTGKLLLADLLEQWKRAV